MSFHRFPACFHLSLTPFYLLIRQPHQFTLSVPVCRRREAHIQPFFRKNTHMLCRLIVTHDEIFHSTLRSHAVSLLLPILFLGSLHEPRQPAIRFGHLTVSLIGKLHLFLRFLQLQFQRTFRFIRISTAQHLHISLQFCLINLYSTGSFFLVFLHGCQTLGQLFLQRPGSDFPLVQQTHRFLLHTSCLPILVVHIRQTVCQLPEILFESLLPVG